YCIDNSISIVKKSTLLITTIFLTLLASAQETKISSADLRILRHKEDTLKLLAKNLLTDTLTGDRMRNDSLFIRTFVRSLQVKNSFYYSFDSVQGISKLFAPDSSFKIYTWQISFDYYVRQRGAIQYYTKDGSLKLVPLKDYSEFTDSPIDSVRTKDNWIGAVYYNITETKYNGKNYYTLFGYDENSVRSNKKWIDVLTFDNRNMPVFGGPFFSFQKDSIKRPTQYRYSIEYKKAAATTMNYSPDMDMIIVDHLVSESDKPDDPWTLIPDGDYEGFKWQDGKWQHVTKVYNQKLEDGQFPMPDPIRDANGNNNEQKLQDRSDKNKAKKKIKG
ncbi:MAG TPA: hypothetical protein VGO09_00175, partial [Flavisolibacter sp.]|nr:hypothetical protein [Flavisolibacter sp.]